MECHLLPLQIIQQPHQIVLCTRTFYRQQAKLLEAALASDEKKAECNAEVDKLIGFFHQGIAIGYDFDLQMRQTADTFATDMLCIKFLQGLPLVGVIGGPSNVVYCKKISDYARLKYQKRYLLQKGNIVDVKEIL